MRAVAFVAAFAAVCSAGAQLIGIDYDSGRLYNISATTGAVTLRTATTLTGGSDLAYGPDGRHYAFSSGPSASLYRLNIDTGAKTLVGSLGLPYTFEGALTFSNTGTAYATNAGEAENPSFFTLNTATGAASIVTTIGFLPHDVNGMVWRSDGKLVCIDRETNSLSALDPATGSIPFIRTYDPSIGDPNLGEVGGMCIFNGSAYFVTGGTGTALPGDNTLWRVDLITGAPTSIGVLNGITGTGISGLTIVPEPISFVAMIGAIVMFSARRKGGKR